MWLSAEERHNHRQALCDRLQHNCSPCNECDTHVVLMVCIPGAKRWRSVCNATHRLCDGKRVTLCQTVRGSFRAVSAVSNTCVFQTETRVVADASR